MSIETNNILLLLFAGGVSGFLNTLASSGSAVSLPALMFLGLDAHAANATNRLSLLLGSITRLVVFQRKKAIDWKISAILLAPFLLGALAGAWLADIINNESLGYVIDVALVLAFIMVIGGAKRFIVPRENRKRKIGVIQHGLFFLIGGWTGLIVLDAATYLLMALVMVVGLDLVKANTIKAVLAFGAGVVSIVIFAMHHEVQWVQGLILSLGSMIGSWAGAHLAVKEQSRKLVFALLILIVGGEVAALLAERFFY